MWRLKLFLKYLKKAEKHLCCNNIWYIFHLSHHNQVKKSNKTTTELMIRWTTEIVVSSTWAEGLDDGSEENPPSLDSRWLTLAILISAGKTHFNFSRFTCRSGPKCSVFSTCQLADILCGTNCFCGGWQRKLSLDAFPRLADPRPVPSVNWGKSEEILHFFFL